MRGLTITLPRTCAALLLLAGLAAPGAALASDANVAALGPGYTSFDAPLGAPSELRIALVGKVNPRCRMADAPVPAPLNLNGGGETQTSFTLDCNAPFRMRVQSDHGGMQAESIREGIAQVVPYDVAFTVGTDQGTRPLGWCSAEQLADTARAHCPFGKGGGWSSDHAVAINKSGTLGLRWSDPQQAAQPALGRYRDTIVIVLSVNS